MIGRGNTNYFAYPIPTFSSAIESLYITYVQHDHVVVEKTLDDEDVEIKEIDGINHVLVKLTQNDSLHFTETILTSKDYVEVQIRIKTEDGDAYDSVVMNDRVQKLLKDGVI